MGVDYFNLLLKIGSLSGLISVMWLIIKDVNKWRKQPRLKIEFDEEVDVREYKFHRLGWHRKFFNLRIFNKGKTIANRCVASLEIIGKPKQAGKALDKRLTLHWADVDYNLSTNASQPVDIGRDESRRLNVVFTDKDIKITGSWVAIPMALVSPQEVGQAFLPEGEYIVKVLVNCENGKGDENRFKIISPKGWKKLKVSALE